MGGKVSKEPEREYFCRFAQGIVGTSTVILRDVLRSYVPCTDLLDALNHRAVPLKLNKRQKDLVKNAATKGYKEFDISFLYYLLRNLCSNLSNLENLTNPRISTENLPQPSKGWDKEPLPLNISLSDDIERIRLLRNEAFAHIPHAKLSKDEYDIYWGKLKDICSRCKSHYRLRQFKHDYKKELRHLEKYNPKDKKAEIIVNTVSEMHGNYNCTIQLLPISFNTHKYVIVRRANKCISSPKLKLGNGHIEYLSNIEMYVKKANATQNKTQEIVRFCVF